MTNISKAPQVLAQSEQLNASPLNSAQHSSQRKDFIVIAMAFGQEVTLTGEMLGGRRQDQRRGLEMKSFSFPWVGDI